MNPQWMIGKLNFLATDTQSLTALFQIPVPVNKLAIPNHKPIIVELLRADFWSFPAHGSIIPNTAGVGTVRSTAVDLALTYGSPFLVSASSNNIDFANPLLITAWSSQNFERVSSSSALAPADVAYMIRDDQPYSIDLTDGAGHGTLVASDNIGFYVGITSAFPTTYLNTVRILYRFKAVNLEEYVTMLQSQQSRTF